MKLNKKLFLGIGLIWILFFAAVYVGPYSFLMRHFKMNDLSYFLISLFLLTLFFTVLTILIVRILLIKRVERLDAHVGRINSLHSFDERLHVSNNDELTFLAAKINKLLDLIQSSKVQLETRVLERTQSLQKTNLQLQQELEEQKSFEKELETHKEHLVHLAHYDLLTSLPNRVFFNEILNKALSHSSRQKNCSS